MTPREQPLPPPQIAASFMYSKVLSTVRKLAQRNIGECLTDRSRGFVAGHALTGPLSEGSGTMNVRFTVMI